MKAQEPDAKTRAMLAAPQLVEALLNLDDFCRVAVDAGQLNADEVEWRLIEAREALAAAGALEVDRGE